MYYKVILQTDFSIFVTEMEGTRFQVLQANFADRFKHVCHRKYMESSSFHFFDKSAEICLQNYLVVSGI